MMLEEIVHYLELNGIGTRAVDLFFGEMPPMPDSAVCVYEYAGRPPEFDMNGLAMRSPGLQLVVRDKIYKSARDRIESVVHALSGKTDLVIDGIRYYSIAAIQEPFPIQQDDNGRNRLVVNFEVARQA